MIFSVLGYQRLACPSWPAARTGSPYRIAGKVNEPRNCGKAPDPIGSEETKSGSQNRKRLANRLARRTLFRPLKVGRLQQCIKDCMRTVMSDAAGCRRFAWS